MQPTCPSISQRKVKPEMNNTDAASVSVIVPVYKNSDGVKRLLRGLSSQVWLPSHFNIILVNNSSEALSVRAPSNLDVLFLHCEEIGSYACRNVGIRRSNADLLFFTDSDCVPSNEWIKQLYESAKRSERLIVGGAIEFDTSYAKENAVFAYQTLFALSQQNYVEVEGFAATANFACHRSAFSKVGLFDTRLRSGGDFEFSKRAKEKDYRIEYSPAARVLHSFRDSLSDLLGRARRTTGGRFVGKTQIQGERGASALAGCCNHLLRSFLQKASTTRGVTNASLSVRMGLVMISILVLITSLYELFRLFLGGEASR